MTDPVFVDDRPRAGWFIAPFICVVAGILAATAGGSAAFWPLLICWAVSWVFVVYSLRQPAISVSIGEAEATVTERWPKSTRVTSVPLKHLGPVVVVDDGGTGEPTTYGWSWTGLDNRDGQSGGLARHAGPTVTISFVRRKVQRAIGPPKMLGAPGGITVKINPGPPGWPRGSVRNLVSSEPTGRSTARRQRGQSGLIPAAFDAVRS